MDIVENLPSSSTRNVSNSLKRGNGQHIEEIREGITSNMALMSAAVRSQKGCLRPKVNPLPSTIMMGTDDIR